MAPFSRRSLVFMAVLVAAALETASPFTIPQRSGVCVVPLRMVLSTGPEQEHRRASGVGRMGRIRRLRERYLEQYRRQERSQCSDARTTAPRRRPLLARDIKGELRSELLKMAPHYGPHTVRKWWVGRDKARRGEAEVQSAGSVADAGGKVVLAFFLISLLDDAGALLALFCTGCATSGSSEWIKPICSAVPFEPDQVLQQLQQAFHFTSTSLFL